MAGTMVAGLVLVMVLATGATVTLREWASTVAGYLPASFGDWATVTLLSATLILVLQLVELPSVFYQDFLLEHRYGLSTQSSGHWLADQAKGVALGTLIAVAGANVVFLTLRSWPDRWWVISTAAFTVAVAGLARLAPLVLLPMFYRFAPIERPELVARLLLLSAQARTDVVGVFEWVVSGHTKKANAALAGMGRTRRILLADTLLADYSEDEIEVILAHELAHHVHKDVWRGIALQTVVLAGGFYLAALVLRTMVEPLGLWGVADPAGLPVLLIVGGVWSGVTLPLANALSRAQERAADQYALAATGNVEAFISAMKRISQQNLAEEYPSPMVRWLFYSHPPIRERIEAARAFEIGGSSCCVSSPSASQPY